MTPLSDPRQITIIIQSDGTIQSPFGLLPYEPGDLLQIPPHTFSFYVKKGGNIFMLNLYMLYTNNKYIKQKIHGAMY